MRCRHGPEIRLRGSRQRDPQVPDRFRCHDRHRHAADPARSGDGTRARPLRGRHASATTAPAAAQAPDGYLLYIKPSMTGRRARRRSPVPRGPCRVPARDHVRPVVRRVPVRELPQAGPSHRAARVPGRRHQGAAQRRRDPPPGAGADVRRAQGALVSAERGGQGRLLTARRPAQHAPGARCARTRASASWTPRSTRSGTSSCGGARRRGRRACRCRTRSRRPGPGFYFCVEPAPAHAERLSRPQPGRGAPTTRTTAGGSISSSTGPGPRWSGPPTRSAAPRSARGSRPSAPDGSSSSRAGRRSCHARWRARSTGSWTKPGSETS